MTSPPFIPGGKLGKKLRRIEALMHAGEDIPRVLPTAKMPDVIYEMSRKGLGLAAVTDDGRLLGIITDGDLRRVMQKRRANVLDLRAADCLTKNPVTLPRTELAAAALRLMEEKKITSVLVVDADGFSKAWCTSTTSGPCSSSIAYAHP